MRVVAAGMAFVISGCSFLVAKGPSDSRAPREVPTCNPSKGSVGADATFAVASGLGTVVAVGADSAGTAAALGLIGLVFTGAAVYGSSSANRCRASLAEFAAVEEAPPLPPAVIPTPTVAATAPAPAPAAAPAAAPAPAAAAERESDSDWPDFWVEVVP